MPSLKRRQDPEFKVSTQGRFRPRLISPIAGTRRHWWWWEPVHLKKDDRGLSFLVDKNDHQLTEHYSALSLLHRHRRILAVARYCDGSLGLLNHHGRLIKHFDLLDELHVFARTREKIRSAIFQLKELS